MRVLYKWNDNTVIAEVQSIVLEPVAELFIDRSILGYAFNK